MASYREIGVGLGIWMFAFWQTANVGPATHITDQLIAADSTKYAAYSSGEVAEALVNDHSQFDAAHNEFLIVRHPQDEISVGHAPDGDTLHELKALAYNADVIIAGRPTRRISALTQSHQFIFSDYEVTVSQVYTAKQPAVVAGQQIVITRPGGVTTIAGQAVRAIEPEFPLFRLNQEYLFFLHYDSSTRTFVVNPSEAYLLTSGQVQSGRNHSKIVPSSVSADRFFHDLDIAIASDKKVGK